LFNFTETHSVVFQPATVNEQRFEELIFEMPQDNIVELQEVFRWRLSVNDSRVRINPDTQIVRLDNQDVFSIGFRELTVTIGEGENASLTIKQIGGETAGVGIGGFPEDRLSPVRLRHVPGNATIDSDFSLNTTVPGLTYRPNNTLNDIPFEPITSFEDNIIEGNEILRVIIVPGGDNAVQVQSGIQTATITIIDDDTGVLSLERGTYDVIENEGTVEICAVLTGGVLSTDTEITIQAEDNTARFRSDYSTHGIHSVLRSFTNKTCGRFNITNDLISEQLLENCTIAIIGIFPENSGLKIDQSPTFIRIQDDDQAEVRFAMGQATFSEGGGNQSITVILGGAQLSQSEDVEVYIDDGTTNGTSLGFVTFGTGAIPQNRTVVFPVVDNNIALEPDKHYLLRLRNIGSIGLGNPETMNVTVEDEDVTQKLPEDVIVQCYSSAADCTTNTNGVSLAAIDCCNRTGGGYISHSSLNVVAQCGACIVVGFDQTRVHIGPSDAGRRYSFTADVLLSTPGAPTNEVRDLCWNISREPATLVDVADYLRTPVFSGQTDAFLPKRFNLQYLSYGNELALQPTLSIHYTIAPSSGESIPSGVVLVYNHLSITIDDIDIMSVGLELQCFPFVEGSTAVAVIRRKLIEYEAPFEVTVSLGKFRNPYLFTAVGEFDNFNFTEQHSVVFHPEYQFDQHFERVTFLMSQDNIVELQEVFQWRLTVNDSRVRINPNTQIVRLDNRDVFRVGFKDLHVTIREGQVATLTIKQIGNETGGVDIGGFPQNHLQPVQLVHISGTATNGSDFLLNSTVPRLTYSANNTLNDMSFTPIISIDDSIIEGDETIRVIILSNGNNVLQIPRDQRTATIAIIDDDTGVLSLERRTYDVIENEGTVEICAVLTGGVLPTDTEITLQARDNTAVCIGDYSTLRIRPTLHSFANRACGRFRIRNDLISEQLFENFTVAITDIFPVNNRLTVDRSPSFIRIQDDDQAEVRFAMGQTTFSEGGGNQSITVILGGAQLSQSEDVEVYIDDGITKGTLLGFVTFSTGAIPQNRTVVFPVVDDNIALEPDKLYLLRLRNIGNIGLGNPETMNVTVEDDDVVDVFLERRSYDVIENQTSIKICVVLTKGFLSTPMNINIFDAQGTAKYQFDYIFFNFHVILPPYKNSTCVTLYIVNDNIKETLYEEMHMYIFRVIPWNKNLHVDYTWSTVRIQDDDN
uniref:Calx-beta domain-containing protein n=2 Tax=Amphimedon queenslandica TaxID=400682 RepID=A0A1X7U4D3_AMPQE